MFLRRFNPYFSRYVFPLNSDDFSDETFFLQLHLLLIFPSFEFFYHLIFRDISLKSQETFVLSFVTFHLIFNGISFTFFSFELCLSYPFIRWFIRLFYSCIIIRLFSHIFLIWLFYFDHLFLHLFVLSFELFSLLIYLFIFVFFVLVKLC